MRQFVGNQPPPFMRRRRELTRAKHDVVTRCVSFRVDIARRFFSSYPRVNSNLGKIETKAFSHICAERPAQLRPGGGKHTVHALRRRIPRFGCELRACAIDFALYSLPALRTLPRSVAVTLPLYRRSNAHSGNGPRRAQRACGHDLVRNAIRLTLKRVVGFTHAQSGGHRLAFRCRRSFALPGKYGEAHGFNPFPIAPPMRVPRTLPPDGPGETGMRPSFNTGVRCERAQVARVAGSASTRDNSV